MPCHEAAPGFAVPGSSTTTLGAVVHRNNPDMAVHAIPPAIMIAALQAASTHCMLVVPALPLVRVLIHARLSSMVIASWVIQGCNDHFFMFKQMQVYTSRQHAIGIVYAYPLSNRNFEICEALAATREEPSVQQLLEDTSVSDLQHAANWKSVIEYNSALRRETVPVYVKFAGRLAEPLLQFLDANMSAPDVGLIPVGNKHILSVSAASHCSIPSVPLVKPSGRLQ